MICATFFALEFGCEVNGVNRTLQALLSEVVRSLNQLSRDGVYDPVTEKTFQFRVMSVRGDWKFLKQAFNLTRHPGTEYICWKCSAAKGTRPNTAALNFTDLSASAAWVATIGVSEAPFKDVPAITLLDFFSEDKISMDVLHIWYLGVGRDMMLILHFKSF